MQLVSGLLSVELEEQEAVRILIQIQDSPTYVHPDKTRQETSKQEDSKYTRIKGLTGLTSGTHMEKWHKSNRKLQRGNYTSII